MEGFDSDWTFLSHTVQSTMRAWSLCVVMSVCSCHVKTGEEKEIKLPSYVDICYRDDPKVAECIKKTIQKLMPMFKKGSTDFDLEPLDPVFFDHLRFSYKSPIMGGDVVTSNSYFHGITSSRVLSVRPKLNIPHLFILDFDLEVPQMVVKTDYNLNGNVLNIPVNIEGRVDVLFESINITYHISGNTKTIDNYDYLDIDKFTWRFTGSGINKMTVRNKDIVDGRPAINRIVRAVMKSSWRPLMDQMLPAILPESDKKLKAKFTKAFKKYPYDIIFPRRTRIQAVETPHHTLNNNKKKDMIS